MTASISVDSTADDGLERVDLTVRSHPVSVTQRCFDGRTLQERDALLASLDGHLAAAVNGEGRLVFVAGEAGVGKTALTRQFIETAQGVRVLRGTVDSSPTAAPLGPFLEALTADEGEFEPLLEARSRLFPAMRRALATTPTLLVLEDLHWADQATLDLLDHLGRRLEALPALIVCTFRDDEVTGSHPLTLVLGDLASRDGVTRMQVPRLSRPAVSRLALEAGSPLDLDELYRRTGGNAFFVTEVLAAETAEVTPSVRDAALARAARLSLAGRRVLDAAAVIGGAVELELLRSASGQPTDAIDECCDLGMLVGAGSRLKFRHELAREAVQQAVPVASRAGLHAAALAWLTNARIVDHRRMSYHAVAGGDATAVLVHAPKAGDRAAGLGAHREAAEHYRTALRYDYLLEPSPRAELLERLSYECYVTDQLQAAADARLQALELHRSSGDTRKLGVAQRWLSRLSWFLGRGADSEQYALDALATLEPLGPGAELAMAYSYLAQLRMLADRDAEAVRWGRKAIELARALGDREVEAHALNNVGTALWGTGHREEGYALLARSLDLALALDAHEHAARAYTNLGTEALEERRYAEADRHLRAGIAYSQERDLDAWSLYMEAWQARSLAEQGEFDAAQLLADKVLRRPQQSQFSRMQALVIAARIRVWRGEPGADAMLDEALALAEGTGAARRIVPVMLARIEAAWIAGRSLGTELRRAERLSIDNAWDIGELAWWARRADPDTDVPADCAEPFVLMVTGRAHDAATAWARRGSPIWQALALTASDRADDVRDGVEMLRALGADATVHAVLRDLRSQGKAAPRGPRPTSRANPAGLTARELEVLTLLADGLSNADIAGRLYLSDKTVGHHVSAVLRKLGEPTRSRAAAAAQRKGFVPT
jgi:DNA-binding CsgD family transcriptional regulator/tetratricopeptide (TPR) repeat protein